jgi:hypothetical protein
MDIPQWRDKEHDGRIAPHKRRQPSPPQPQQRQRPEEESPIQETVHRVMPRQALTRLNTHLSGFGKSARPGAHTRLTRPQKSSGTSCQGRRRLITEKRATKPPWDISGARAVPWMARA